MSPPLPHVPPVPEATVVPRYHKLSFPTYDGKDDSLGWLNQCDQFFRAQQTHDGEKVWLASYHLTGTAQQWYIVLEWDSGVIVWDDFKRLCQQCFGPALSTNHLADLARLLFMSSVEAYLEVFQARMAHAGPLSPYQQAQLFIRGLPNHIWINVELHDPQDLQ